MHLIHEITVDRKINEIYFKGEGAIWWNMVWKEHNQSAPCSQLLWQNGRKGFTWTQISPPAWRWASHDTQIDTTDANKNTKTCSRRTSIGSSRLSSKFVRKKNVSLLSHSPQRCICKCHACQIVSNCVSRRCHIFPGTEKTSGCKCKTTCWYLLYFIFESLFLDVRRQKSSKIGNSTAIFNVN